jgi:hypothetical protein
LKKEVLFSQSVPQFLSEGSVPHFISFFSALCFFNTRQQRYIAPVALTAAKAVVAVFGVLVDQ